MNVASKVYKRYHELLEQRPVHTDKRAQKVEDTQLSSVNLIWQIMCSIFLKDKNTGHLLSLLLCRSASCWTLTQALPLEACPRQSIQSPGLLVTWYHHRMQTAVLCNTCLGCLAFKCTFTHRPFLTPHTRLWEVGERTKQKFFTFPRYGWSLSVRPSKSWTLC